MKRCKVAVLGDGGWGTTLALILSQNRHAVTIWGAFEDYVAQLNTTRRNSKFLPGIPIPKAIKITHYIGEAVSDADVVVLAAPSEHAREVLRTVARVKPLRRGVTFLSATKGIETASLMRMSQIIREELGPVKAAVLSGPTIAREVATGIPTVAVIASRNHTVRRQLQSLLMTPKFRL
ncbi:MAG: NAD(P)-binding domain-containing protein, partial [Candidatus Omnitrophica bacterium]|nr:NAD(P)-binding domain-containing protein [Candidatus Omnitrophota bacterium]